MSRRIWVPNPSHETINCWIADKQPIGGRWLVKRFLKGDITARGEISRLEIAELEQMVKDGLAIELDPPGSDSAPKSYFDPNYRPLDQTGES